MATKSTTEQTAPIPAPRKRTITGRAALRIQPSDTTQPDRDF